MAGVCPCPENSPDPIGVPVNPGGGLTPEREGWAAGQARDTTEGKCSIGPAGPVN